ncbi:MAG: His/Gly/Thr/Pro-type tRNA ligase C-terminal domain-containing protein [Patescibacteria group bacterium]
MTEQKPIQNRDAKEINEAGKIARFYGFKPIISPIVEKQDFELVKNFNQDSHPAENAALLRIYFEDRMMSLPQPHMLFCERPFRGIKEKKKPLHLEASLISIGSSKSVCECLSIQTCITILNKLGYKNIEVHLNSVGDKDSMNEFQKKLMIFIKKNYNSFPTDLRQIVKKDPFAILRKKQEEWQEFQTECPKSLDFLSETSRTHFKEILEFLEILEIPYQIDHHLVSNPDISSETIFSLVDNSVANEQNQKGELAYGFRFNRLAKKLGYKKDLACSILNISAKLKKNLTKVKAKTVKPQFYLIQFGPEAKLKSFLVLEELYKAGASVIHSIAKDKLSSQIGIAENSDATYIILLGQKEALENSVVIRNTLTRAQEIVPIFNLTEKVKELI